MPLTPSAHTKGLPKKLAGHAPKRKVERKGLWVGNVYFDRRRRTQGTTHTPYVEFPPMEHRDPRPSLAPSLLSSSLPPVGVEGYPSCVVARDAMKCRGLSDCVPLHCVRHPLESSEPTNNPVPMCNGATSHSLRSDKTVFLLCPTTVFAPNRWSRY